MTRVNEIMTESPVCCSPDTPVSEVAEIMHDRNIGNVLVTEKGKLRGMVTDRDLVVRALNDGKNPGETPVRDVMTTHVVTGHPDWDLGRVASVMVKHRIRRLPIVQNDEVVGIVSLGDVALSESKKQNVGKSLAKISEPAKSISLADVGKRAMTMGLLAGAGVLTAWMSMNKFGQQVRQQVKKARR